MNTNDYKPRMMYWQRPLIEHRPCASCSKRTNMEKAVTPQCEPNAYTDWVPLCFTCNAKDYFHAEIQKRMNPSLF